MTRYEMDLMQTIDEHKLDLNYLDKKTILFTGACGLIGRYFINLILFYDRIFSKNIKIIAVDLNEDKLISIFSGELENTNLVLISHNISHPLKIDLPIDFIIHAASPANPYFYANYPVETINANYLGSLNMLNLAKKKNVKKYIFVSSGEVYGSTICDGLGFTEKDIGLVDCSISRSCYTEGKRSAETLAHCFHDQYNLPVIVARLCHTYGPTYSDTDNRAIFQFINSFLKNEDIIMKSVGSQTRSYCYVGDTVCAFLSLLEYGIDNETYNVSNNNSICTIKQIAEHLTSLDNKINLKVVNPSFIESKGFSPFEKAVLDGTKLTKIGFMPIVSLKDGLLRTIECKKEMIK